MELEAEQEEKSQNFVKFNDPKISNTTLTKPAPSVLKGSGGLPHPEASQAEGNGGGAQIKYRSRRGRKIANNFYRSKLNGGGGQPKAIKKGNKLSLTVEAKIIRKLRKIDRHIERKRTVKGGLLPIPELESFPINDTGITTQDRYTELNLAH